MNGVDYTTLVAPSAHEMTRLVTGGDGHNI